MTVYLMDPYLIDFSGHCYNYLSVLDEELKKRKYKTVLVGNELCTKELSDLDVRPIFSKSTLNPTKHKLIRDLLNLISNRLFEKSPRNEVIDFFNNLENVISILNVKKDDVIFINSIRPGQFLGFSYWLKSKNMKNLPKFIVVLHFTCQLKNYSGRVYKRQYIKAFNILNSIDSGENLTIFSDTAELIDEFKKLNAHNVELAPIPTIMDNMKPKKNENFINKNKYPLTISFIGQARKDKGFHLLPETGRYLTHLIKSGHVIFKVQCGTSNHKKSINESIIAELKDIGATIVNDTLTEQDYRNFISSSDIILLPYLGHSYRFQSSGIFSEAIANGKIVIVSENTWMAKQLKILEINSPIMKLNKKNLSECVAECLARYNSIKQIFSIKSEQWNKMNDIEKIINKLI